MTVLQWLAGKRIAQHAGWYLACIALTGLVVSIVRGAFRRVVPADRLAQWRRLFPRGTAALDMIEAAGLAVPQIVASIVAMVTGRLPPRAESPATVVVHPEEPGRSPK